MMRVAFLLLLAAATVEAQDSSFAVLRVRATVLRLPIVGPIEDDWQPKTGGQVDLASNLARSEIALSVGRVGFTSLTSKPPFTETLISLAWTHPLLQAGAFEFAGGSRLTDVRMHFDDPSMVAGLRNEEEQLISAVGRGRMRLWGSYSGLVEGSYGVLMTSTRTPTMTLTVGIERGGRMPLWLRDFLR